MKKLDPKQKKIVDIVVTSIEVIIVLLAIILSAIIIANPNQNSTEVSKGNVKLLPVLSDSMDGDKKDSFKKGDLLVSKTPKDILALQEGDIITFVGSVNGYDALITHRIIKVEKDSEGNTQTYITRGDNPAIREDDVQRINPHKVLAVYKYHLKGVGSAIWWLQDSTHFLLVIVLPLALLFVWNIIQFVRMLMQWKLEKAVAGGQGGTAESAISAEEEAEIRRKAVEEYLAAQQARASETVIDKVESNIDTEQNDVTTGNDLKNETDNDEKPE